MNIRRADARCRESICVGGHSSDNTEMNLVKVKSSSVYAVGYDRETMTMDVVFYRTGIHRFADIPGKVYKEFMSSDSPGSHYALFLERRYGEHQVKDASGHS